MKPLIAAFVASMIAAAAAAAPAPASPAPHAAVATPVHKKAAPPAKYRKAAVKRDRIKK